MILVTGGARSGKSRLAERLAASDKGVVLYIATSHITDDDMAQRVARHRRERPAHWLTWEGHRELGQVIRDHQGRVNGVLLECVTTLITNLLFDEAGETPPDAMDFDAIEAHITTQIDGLVAACIEADCQVVVVTNELGMGIVPENLLARRFRDIAGRVNQRLAAAAEQVWLVVSGIPVAIKGEGAISPVPRPQNPSKNEDGDAIATARRMQDDNKADGSRGAPQ